MYWYASIQLYYHYSAIPMLLIKHCDCQGGKLKQFLLTYDFYVWKNVNTISHLAHQLSKCAHQPAMPTVSINTVMAYDSGSILTVIIFKPTLNKCRLQSSQTQSKFSKN